MKKIFCKRNLIVGGIMLGVLLAIVFALVFGKTDASETNQKADVLIYCLVAILLAVVMFNSIIKIIDKKTKHIKRLWQLFLFQFPCYYSYLF